MATLPLDSQVLFARFRVISWIESLAHERRSTKSHEKSRNTKLILVRQYSRWGKQNNLLQNRSCWPKLPAIENEFSADIYTMIVGTEWLVDARGCRVEALRDVAVLRMIFARVIDDLNLQVVGEMRWHKFPPPGGVTGFALLSESHLACHTYPEHGLATINLYCCRSRPEWSWAETLREALGAQDVRVRAIQRRAAIDNGIDNAIDNLPKLEHSLQLALAKES